MKLCRTCDKEKELSEFNKNKAKADGYGSMCRSCMKEYRKRHYKNNRQELIQKTIDRKKMIREWFFSMKENFHCKLCDENHIAALDFHHRNPKDKEYSVTWMMHTGHSKESILKELDKCDVLCANCHRKHHYNERNADVV